MSTYFECRRCNYISLKKKDMKEHLGKNKTCKIKDIFNIQDDKILYEQSLKPLYDTLGVYSKYECYICSKKFIDNPHKIIHEKTCKKRKEKFNLSNEEIKLKYNKTKKLINETKEIAESDIIDNFVLDISSIDIVPFIYRFDMCDLTNDDRQLSVYNFDFWKFIKKIFENPRNHNILLNDPEKNNVIVFLSKERGFEKLDISEFLIICLNNIEKYHEFYIYKTILFKNFNRNEKDLLYTKNKIKYLNYKNIILKNIEKHNQKIYTFISNLIPFYDEKIEEFKYLNQHLDLLIVNNNFLKLEKKKIDYEYFLYELEQKGIYNTFNSLKLYNHFTDLYTNTKIECLKHGEFEIKPITFLESHGCIECIKEKENIYNKESFIETSLKIHKDKPYDYSKVNYTNLDNEVEIICKKHKSFKIKPIQHILDGIGCSLCKMKLTISNVSIEWLNFISIFNGIFIQHGKNGKEFRIPTTRYRADGYCKESNTIYEFHGSFWHGDIRYYNKNDINYMTKTTFGHLYENTKKREEHIKKLGFNLVVIWEFDWYKIIRMVKRVQKSFRKKMKKRLFEIY